MKTVIAILVAIVTLSGCAAYPVVHDPYGGHVIVPAPVVVHPLPVYVYPNGYPFYPYHPRRHMHPYYR